MLLDKTVSCVYILAKYVSHRRIHDCVCIYLMLHLVDKEADEQVWMVAS
jgi:hypothetical protein